jgi:GT2 family glycosyltransferase
MANPIVSVIIVTLNGKALLAESLAALCAQTLTDFEIIVVDNGSTDGSSEWLAENFPQARLVRSNVNTGFAKGNNLGMRVARGEFIALLNNDAVPEPTWLAELVGALRRHPEAGFAASRVVLHANPNVLESAGDSIAGSGSIFRRGYRCALHQFDQEEFVFGAQACAAIYRRAMLDEIGLFDEDFFLVYEDADLSFRAQLRGFKCIYVPSAIVRHHGEATIGAFSSLYVYQNQRNVEFVFVKNMPMPLFWRVLPGHLLYNLMGFGFYILRKQGFQFIRAKFDALRALPALVRKRRQVQCENQVDTAYIESHLARGWVKRILHEKTRHDQSAKHNGKAGQGI